MVEDEVSVDFWAYPLRWGDTLATNEWVPWLFNDFLESEFVTYCVAEGRREDIGTAQILWSQSYRQNPAGTLPDDDVLLARLAYFGTDVAGWRAVRDRVLYGWQPVHIDGAPDHAGRSGGARLGHPVIAKLASDSFRRKAIKAQGRGAAQVALDKTRVRKKLIEMGRAKLADVDDIVVEIAKHLRMHNLYMTTDNVAAAMEIVAGGGPVTPFPGRRQG